MKESVVCDGVFFVWLAVASVLVPLCFTGVRYLAIFLEDDFITWSIA